MTKTKIKMASCADFPAPLEKLLPFTTAFS